MPVNVQFTNKNDVLEAYKRMGIGPWAIWCGKAMNFSCNKDSISDCTADLAEYLEMLDRQEMAAYYTLCVYDDLDGSRITNKTDYVASFIFRLSDSARDLMRTGDSMAGMTIGSLRKQWESEKILLDEVRALRMEVQELKNDDGGYEEDSADLDDYGLGKIGKILQHPTIGPMAQNFVGALTDFIRSAAPVRKISGVPGQVAGSPDGGEDLKLDSVALGALKVLYNSVPDFTAVLVKLSEMATKQPGTLQTYVNILKTMQL